MERQIGLPLFEENVIKKIGTVKAILNDQYLLIESTETLSADMTVIVFKSIDAPTLKDTVGLEQIDFPKGRLDVVSRQDGNLYLVSTAKTVLKRKVVYKDNPLAKSLLGISYSLSEAIGRSEEVVSEEPVREPAFVNKKQSLDLEFSKIISVGDSVGLEE